MEKEEKEPSSFPGCLLFMLLIISVWIGVGMFIARKFFPKEVPARKSITVCHHSPYKIS